MLSKIFFGFLSWKLSLRVLSLSSSSDIDLKMTTSQLSFPFHVYLPTLRFHPRQMAVSHLVFLQGNEKSYKDPDPLPPLTRGQIDVVQRLRSEPVPGVREMLQLLPGGLRHEGKNYSGPARKWPGERNGGVLPSWHSTFSHPTGGMALGGTVLVTQAGAAPVQPKLLPVGFPLPNRALLICRCDAQSWPLAPAAQAGLQGDKKMERGFTSVGYRVIEEETFPS